MTEPVRREPRQRVEWFVLTGGVSAAIAVAILATRSPASSRHANAADIVIPTSTALAPSAPRVPTPAIVGSQPGPSGHNVPVRVEEPIDVATWSFLDLEERWTREPEDPEWTLNAKTFIEAALDGNDAGKSALLNTRCRQTVCRAKFDGTDPGPLVTLAKAEKSVGVSAKYQRVATDGGGYVVVAYFGRAASEHPVIEP